MPIAVYCPSPGRVSAMAWIAPVQVVAYVGAFRLVLMPTATAAWCDQPANHWHRANWYCTAMTSWIVRLLGTPASGQLQICSPYRQKTCGMQDGGVLDTNSVCCFDRIDDCGVCNGNDDTCSQVFYFDFAGLTKKYPVNVTEWQEAVSELVLVNLTTSSGTPYPTELVTSSISRFSWHMHYYFNYYYSNSSTDSSRDEAHVYGSVCLSSAHTLM